MKWIMLVEDILNLKSGDSLDENYRYAGETVGEKLADKPLSDVHDRIRDVMAREGVNLVPVCFQNDFLVNGHRRIKMALELGHKEMWVTDSLYDSGWDEEYTVIGETQ